MGRSEEKENLLYKQVENSIRAKIQTNQLKPGDRIPSEAELQLEHGVSRITVRNAITRLVEDDVLVRLQGKGTYVASQLFGNNLCDMISFSVICKMQGLAPSSMVISKELVVPSQEDAAFLHIPSGGQVLEIKRLRLVNDIPLILESSFFHPSFSFLMHDDITGSTYELLAGKYNVYASKGTRVISICRVNEYESQFLNVAAGEPLIYNRCEVNDLNGNPLHTVNQIVRVDIPQVFKYYV